MTLSLDEYADALSREGQLFRAAVARGPLTTPVPTCPGWNVGQLARHLGYIHRWATHYVAEGVTTSLPSLPESEVLDFGPTDHELDHWLALGVDRLIGALRAAPADLQCWAFLPAVSPLLFWARRQSHETTVHRLDAESAHPPTSAIDAALAADGIDELVTGFAPRDWPPRDGGRDWSFRAHATDTGDAWTIARSGHRLTAVRGDEPATTTVAGPAAALYAALWQRTGEDQLMIDGDPTALDRWRGEVHVRWG